MTTFLRLWGTLLLTGSGVVVNAFLCNVGQPLFYSYKTTSLASGVKDWNELEDILGMSTTTSTANAFPVSIDSVLDPTTPKFSTTHPTLFRERHGWCPYSERVWLIMELAHMDYDTIRIDNTGGPRPSYFAGQTPQMKWPNNGRMQGESMDLVAEIDRRYAHGQYKSEDSIVNTMVSKFQSIFPRARPSSRAAFLFQMNGEPLWKSTFEETLEKTDQLLAQVPGPFFSGNDLSIADIGWAPFLERYRYQLPCLHEGLDPNDAHQYPNLAQWYHAMDQIPEYMCRVKGDASSWRKVLTMAGFGNSGLPPQIQSNMDNLLAKEEREAQDCIDLDIWQVYIKNRPHVQSTPHKEAAAIMTRNREAIVRDIVKQATTNAAWKSTNLVLPKSETEADATLRAMIQALLLLANTNTNDDIIPAGVDPSALSGLVTFLDHRMCVPRDMGAMTAATIKTLGVQLRKAATSV